MKGKYGCHERTQKSYVEGTDKQKMNNLEISIATSSGTRKCFACGSIILDRTIVIGYRTEIVLHEKCLKNLSLKMQEFLGGKK